MKRLSQTGSGGPPETQPSLTKAEDPMIQHHISQPDQNNIPSEERRHALLTLYPPKREHFHSGPKSRKLFACSKNPRKEFHMNFVFLFLRKATGEILEQLRMLIVFV